MVQLIMAIIVNIARLKINWLIVQLVEVVVQLIMVVVQIIMVNVLKSTYDFIILVVDWLN